VVRFIDQFIAMPRVAEVYNIGGGPANSISILEAFRLAESVTGMPMKWEYVDQNRQGDHICYISNLAKMRSHYPQWDITKGLEETFGEIVAAHRGKK
jgi:CDP-paratose 2-epimerase